MGWNDNRRMGNVLFFTLAGKLLIAIVLFSFIFSYSAMAQHAMPAGSKNDTTKKNVLRFKLKAKYPMLVTHVLRVTEETKVRRIFPDSVIKEYERYMTYWYSLLMPDEPVDGFTKLDIIVDSMEYRYKQDGKTFNYKSGYGSVPANTKEAIRKMIPLGKEFRITYSPYGEIVKIEGSRLEEDRQYVTDKKTGIKNPFGRETWVRALSDEHLKFLFDMQKNIVPGVRAPIDSTWDSQFYAEIDDIRFAGKAETKLTSFKNGYLYLETNLDSLKAIQEPLIINDFGKFVELLGSQAEGVYKLQIGPRGLLDYSDMYMKTKVKCLYGRIEFVQETETRYAWELLGRYTWGGK